MKRFLSLLLTLTLLLTLAPFALAEGSYSFYGKSLRPSAFDGEGEDYIRAVYAFIWGTALDDGADLLRELPPQELTADWVKTCVIATPNGSVLGFSSGAMVILSRTGEGFTACADGKELSFTWEEAAELGDLSYIKWPDAPALDPTASPWGSGTEEEQRKVWDFLKSKGFTDFAAAGIMGNLNGESGVCRSNMENSYEKKIGYSDLSYTTDVDSGSYSRYSFIHDAVGYGLAQWTFSTRKESLYDRAKAAGKSISDLDVQLEQLYAELVAYRFAGPVNQCSSVREASDYIFINFEGARNRGEENLLRREEYSLEFFEKFGPEGSIIRFNADGGSNVPAAIYVPVDGTATLTDKIPVKEGYRFLYWSCDGKIYNPGDSFVPEKSVTLRAVYKYLGPFDDVAEDAVYFDAAWWASDSGITTGYGSREFRPQNPCTRAQVVTFLWRSAGSPEPTGENPFVDVKNEGGLMPYYKAIVWAAETGITTGFDETHFVPEGTVTRAQFVTFLWRSEGCPMRGSGVDGFTDAAEIAAPYRDAVSWAIERGITLGYEDGTFRPKASCTRWAVVLFMYRDFLSPDCDVTDSAVITS